MKQNTLPPYSSIYKKLHTIIPDLEKHIADGKNAGKSQLNLPGMMDLHFDYLDDDKQGNPIISLSHYFEQNGDSVPDPDMEIRIITKLQAAEAMTFQNQFVYHQVYEERDGKQYVSVRLKEDLNEFLDQWLSNIIEQGHRIDLSKEEGMPELKKVNERTNEIKELRDDKADENKEREWSR